MADEKDTGRASSARDRHRERQRESADESYHGETRKRKHRDYDQDDRRGGDGKKDMRDRRDDWRDARRDVEDVHGDRHRHSRAGSREDGRKRRSRSPDTRDRRQRDDGKTRDKQTPADGPYGKDERSRDDRSRQGDRRDRERDGQSKSVGEADAGSRGRDSHHRYHRHERGRDERHGRRGEHEQGRERGRHGGQEQGRERGSRRGEDDDDDDGDDGPGKQGSSEHHSGSQARRQPIRQRGALPDQADSFALVQRGGGGGEEGDGAAAAKPAKEKPNFGTTGVLAAASNAVAQADGSVVTLKYHEPAEARKAPGREQWRLFIFKEGAIVETVELNARSCWLVGREAAVVDLLAAHPSVSKQHAVLQFRYVEKRNEFGDRIGGVKPYLIDLASANGTTLNSEALPPQRYLELRHKDMVQFGQSTREYVLMLAKE